MTGERTLAAHEQVPGSRQKAKGRRENVANSGRNCCVLPFAFCLFP
jgi:hypothetical protein